jgi:hypothetical protein
MTPHPWEAEFSQNTISYAKIKDKDKDKDNVTVGHYTGRLQDK